jgi:hypothetical protein
MELVCWKTDIKGTSKSIFNVKVWEKYRTTRGKNAGSIIEISSTSKFIQALKLAWFIIKNYKWL